MSKMKSSIRIRKSDGSYVEKEEERNFNTKNIDEKENRFDFDFIDGDEKEITLNGIKIFFGEMHTDSTLQIETKHNQPFLSITFQIEGNASYMPNKKGSIPFSIKAGAYNFYYMPKIDGVMTIEKGKRKYFTLLFVEDYLKKLFKNNFYTVSSSFGEALKSKTPFLMFNESKPISIKLYEIIMDIANCCYEKDIKEVYIHSKITEIFSYLFSEMKKLKSPIRNTKLKEYDISLVKKAEKIITQNLSSPLTIDELAKLIGSNKFKLKKDFKLVYNESVFSYASRLRMEKAKEMLIENKKNISEIAYAVGYKNPQHFTVAFKKYFNYLPSDLKSA